jgi:hypothetical protein
MTQPASPTTQASRPTVTIKNKERLEDTKEIKDLNDINSS